LKRRTHNGEEAGEPSALEPQIQVRRCRKATASLVFGIGALSFLPGVGAVLAIVYGALAKREIKRDELELRGSKWATAGITLGILGIVLPLAALVLYLGSDKVKDFFREFFNLKVLRESMPYLLRGLLVTIRLAAVSEVCILFLGLIVALVRISRIKIFRAAAAVYIDVVRGIPLILQIVIIYFGLGHLGLNLDRFTAGVLALTICYAAYEAEIFRAGIESIHKGQMEAARSLGMGYLKSMRYIVLPQAVRRVIPPLSNEFIALLKDTALVSVISLSEVFQRGRELMGWKANVTPLVGVALCYLIITIPLMRLVQYVEKGLAKTD
jgi:polar amino acid transport system permease protein